MSANRDIIVRPITGEVRIRIAGDAPGVDESVERAWAELRRGNPRLHDGPILLARADGLGRGELVCRAGGYKELATATALGRGDRVRALGVCGLVMGRDVRGERHVLFGRRGMETRVYGGMWENAPAGTVAPVRGGGGEIGLGDLAAALRDEGLEELGIDLGSAAVCAAATLEDARACSVDVVLQVEVRGKIDQRVSVCGAGAERWEYVDAAWVAEKELGAWVERDAAAISPPTVGLIGWWLGARGRDR